jgi:O-antigen/teichoic acid export membrane protein
MRGPRPTTSRLWGGPSVIAVGLVVLGLASYLFLTTAARALSPEDYASLATFWSLVFALLAGAFSPSEVEGTRAVSLALAQGRSIPAATQPIAAYATQVTAVLLVLLAILHAPIANAFFQGDTDYVAQLGVVAIAFAVIYYVRGVLAGSRRFALYSIILGGEGVVRAALLLALVGIGIATGQSAASALSTAAAVAAVSSLLALAAIRRHQPTVELTSTIRPTQSTSPATRANLGALIIASLAAQGLINAGALTVQALGDDPTLTGAVLAVLVLVRIPVMFISAIQSGFIPNLVALLASGQGAAFDRAVAGVIIRLGLAGASVVAAAAVAGPTVTRLLFGQAYTLGQLDFALLTLSSVVFVLATLFQAVLVSLGRHRIAASAWTAGVLTYLLTLTVPIPLLRQVEIGSLSSMFVVSLIMIMAIYALRRRERRAEAQDQLPLRPEGR